MITMKNEDQRATARDAFAAGFCGYDKLNTYGPGTLRECVYAATVLKRRFKTWQDAWDHWERYGFKSYVPVETGDWLHDWYENSAGGSILRDFREGRYDVVNTRR